MEFRNPGIVPAIVPVLLDSYLGKGRVYFINSEEYPVCYYTKQNIGFFNIASLKQIHYSYALAGLELVSNTWVCLIAAVLELVGKMTKKPASWAKWELLALSPEFDLGGRLELPDNISDFGEAGLVIKESMSYFDLACLKTKMATCFDTILRVSTDKARSDFEEARASKSQKVVWVQEKVYRVPKLFVSFSEYFLYFYGNGINSEVVSSLSKNLTSYIKEKLDKLTLVVGK